MKGYTMINYHGYIIEGSGSSYTLYHPSGVIGTFSSCQKAKAYVNKILKEREEEDE